MTIRRILSTTGDVALQLLQLTAASAEAFPLLKSAAGCALHITDLVKEFRLNKDQWRELGEYVRDATASVVQSLAQVDASRGDTKSKLEKLVGTLDETAKRVESELALPNRKRVLRFMQDLEMIADMRKRVDDDIGLFKLSATITTMIDVGKIFDAVITNGRDLSSIAQDTSAVVVKATSISRKASLLGLNATLDKLSRMQGASWDPSRVCMENTRVELVDRVMVWVKGPNKPSGANQSGGAQIMLLTAVAGAGKTTIAHTVACQCAENKQLGSSFFFDRETEGRNSPAAVFTTIAADLSRLDHRLAKSITAAIEDDRSLTSAPIFRQFEELVLKPCRECPVGGPIVLVIDALDEAWNEDLLDILHDHAHKLPSIFRILLTSRMRPELDSLLRQPHVSGVELNIHAQSNLDDIAVYAPQKLRQLADRRNLGDDWPGSQLRTQFMMKAGGLFLWVATVCTYLYNRDDPEEELRQLVSTAKLIGNSAEDQMNRLYTKILDSYDWTDSSFVVGYHRVMGTAIATKTPITISAMKELYHGQRLATDYTLQKLSPLLTGMSKADHGSEPVRVLHQSLRDFLVIQATSSPPRMEFNIVEKEQSRQLASLCLQLLNRDLSRSIPGTGYLDEGEDEKPGVPVISENVISGALWYACQFWHNHILDVESLKETGEALGRFMDEKTIVWLEVVAARGRCCGLNEVRRLLEDKNEKTGLVPKFHEEYANASLSLSNRLEYEDRREEALEMIEEAVQLYRPLAADRPAVFAPDLASSLNNLSIRLSGLGRREDALAAIQEAVQLRRELAAERPAAFTPDLAPSLNNLSNHLRDLGRREDALTAIHEAVQLYRELATERPAAFAPDLASSLNNLSVYLSDVGRREEALTAIQEAVRLRRELAAERPAAFTPDLASSLNNLSVHLSDLGRREDALAAIQEAGQLYRELAAERPAAFAPDLASSLINLSNHLFDLGRREDALAAIQEAVQLYRELAGARPDVFTPDLAMSLNNLSNRLAGLGRREDALMAVQESVQLRRGLTAERPAAFTPDLASSLNNLSIHLSFLGRREDALTAIQEAMQLYRELATERPAAFTPDLAMSLNNLSNRLSSLGRHEDALKAIQEAVQLRRELAAQRSAAFAPDLALSLNNLSIYLSDLGRREEALMAIQQAAQLYRKLAAERPAAFTPPLASSLDNLSNRLSSLGRREDALKAIQEAVQLRRELAAERPAAFTPDLALSLNNLSVYLSGHGRCEEALAAIQEAVRLRRELAAERPAAFTPDLAMSLNNLSLRLSDLGCRGDALTAIQEAVTLQRQLATHRPFVFNAALKQSLRNLADLLTALDRHPEALVATHDANALSS